MFNLLISARPSAWESRERMEMDSSRFGEYSGDEKEGISPLEPHTLRALERAQTLLMYENEVSDPPGQSVRLGHLRDIRVERSAITFRFRESGRLPRERVLEFPQQLQLGPYELNRTHWAVKDGELPQSLLRYLEESAQEYDVVLSYASENRDYVTAVASSLDRFGVDYFFDRNEEAMLWGRDLVIHFEQVFRNLGRYCVMFISEQYAHKVWPTHERKAALARAITERSEYILPVRFDDTDVPGLSPSIAYVSASTKSPQEVAELIIRKLGRHS